MPAKTKICTLCNTEYTPKSNGYKKRPSRSVFCSRDCYIKSKSGSSNPNYKDGTCSSGYTTFSVNGKKVSEHRYIVEQHLGRKLFLHEHIHHIDGNNISII